MNKLIPIILAVVCVIVAGIGWMSFGSSEEEAMRAAQQKQPPLPDGHVNEPDVIKLSEATAYTTQLKGTAAEVQSLRQDVKEYYGDTEKKIKEATQKALQRELPLMERRLREEIRKEEQARARQEAAAELATKPSSSSNRVVDTVAPATRAETSLNATPTSQRLLDPANAGVPRGFGFDELEAARFKLPVQQGGRDTLSVSGAAATSGPPGFIKISAWQPTASLPQGRAGNAAFPTPATPPSPTKPAATHNAKAEKKPVPVYTIENTSTLFSNTTMTALMGVVPNKNNAVKNLMRFKLITGRENIASNGLYLPDVQNIVWTGYVVGNREMECVQATVDTVTFTFQDGTIRTVENKQKGGGGQLPEGLGYLSDRWGKPCIKGELISNATQYLRDRMIAAGAAATASAASATQTTTIRDGIGGGVTTAVTGDQGKYIAGQTTTASLQELADYLRDRMDQAIDIVYLDAGKDVVIHVEKEISIDYDSAGRKLSHITMSQQQKSRRARLD